MTQPLATVPEGTSLTRLRCAARRLFAAHGYHETRPQDIARAAGVANGTFYLHFADKQQAFLDFAEQAQNELLAVMEQRLREIEGHRERWEALLLALMEFGDANPGLLQAAFLDPVFIAPNDEEAWRMYDRLGNVVSSVLVDTIDGGLDQRGADLEMISHGLCGFLRHAMTYAGRRQLDRRRTVADLSRFIDRALSTEVQSIENKSLNNNATEDKTADSKEEIDG